MYTVVYYPKFKNFYLYYDEKYILGWIYNDYYMVGEIADDIIKNGIFLKSTNDKNRCKHYIMLYSLIIVKNPKIVNNPEEFKNSIYDYLI